jgi:hypothetical protein
MISGYSGLTKRLMKNPSVKAPSAEHQAPSRQRRRLYYLSPYGMIVMLKSAPKLICSRWWSMLNTPWYDPRFINNRLRSIGIYPRSQFKEVSRNFLRVDDHERLVEQTSIDDVTCTPIWAITSNYHQFLCAPYVDFQALKVSHGREGSSRLRTLPSIGREGGPGGNGGCERLSQYFRPQLSKPVSTKADVAK